MVAPEAKVFFGMLVRRADLGLPGRAGAGSRSAKAIRLCSLTHPRRGVIQAAELVLGAATWLERAGEVRYEIKTHGRRAVKMRAR
jgi:hypothetical protein